MEEGGSGEPADAAPENRDPRSRDPCPVRSCPGRLCPGQLCPGQLTRTSSPSCRNRAASARRRRHAAGRVRTTRCLWSFNEHHAYDGRPVRRSQYGGQPCRGPV